MVTIRIPRGATRGEHYGVIWVQQAARVRTARGTAIKEINRVGIRIYLDVGHGGPVLVDDPAGQVTPTQPASLSASLLSGGVTIAPTDPARASAVARSRYS